MSAPAYKTTNPNPSIDGTTVNNGQQGSSNYARNGKAPSPTGSEELNRYVTDDAPRERKAAAAPIPGVMVCISVYKFHLYIC